MKAVLGNKEYLIDESQKKHYVDRGYDIRDEDDVVIAYGRRKTVPYDEYVKVASENSELKERFSMADSISDENNFLKERVKVLSDEIDNLNHMIKSLTDENDNLKQENKSLIDENDNLKQQAARQGQLQEDTKAKSSGKSKPKEDMAAG